MRLKSVYILIIILLMALPAMLSTFQLPAKGSSIALAADVGYGNTADTQAKLSQALETASPETQKCIQCHLTVTPQIVYDWLRSKHARYTPDNVTHLYEKLGVEAVVAEKFQGYPYTVGCYECHGMFKEPDRADVINHMGQFDIVPIVTLKDCSQCHAKEAKEITWTMHGFAALNAPLKPWYTKIVKYAEENNRPDTLPPVYERIGVDLVDWPWYKEYAKKLQQNPNDPEVQQFGTIYDTDFKDIVSPLYPVSGTFASTGIMDDSRIKNSYIYFGCMQCHGTLVVPYENNGVQVKYWGWPSNGAGRIDPDGSLGTCTACHTRHKFSVEEARKPYTCGQCHLGPDHPHVEIYEESKHGNIYDAEGENWDWSAIPWKIGVDFRAPTCATCHMATIADAKGNILVQGSHDLRQRLVWDLLHFFTFPKPKWPDHTQNAIIKGGSQLTGAGLLENGVAVEGYQLNFENALASGEFGFPRLAKITYTGELAQRRDTMKSVCKLCHSSQWVDNYFLIYDQNLVEYNVTANYAFNLLKKAWDEGIQDPSNKLDEYMELMWYYIWHHDGRRWRHGAAMMGPDYTFWHGAVDTVMDKLTRMVNYYNTAVELRNLKQQLETLQVAGVPPEQVAQLKDKISQLESKLSAMEAEVPQLKKQLQDMSTKFTALSNTVNQASSKANQALQKADQLSQTVEGAKRAAEEVKGGINTAMIIGALGLIVAVVAVGLILLRKP